MNSKEISKILYKELRDYITTKSTKPTVVDISIGNDFASLKYAEMKKKQIEKNTDICFRSIHFDTISKDKLIEYINELNNNPFINGVMIQLPLPFYLKSYEREILDTIATSKDVDGLNSRTAGLLSVGANCFIPCTPLGIITLLKSYDVELEGKKVAIINRSNIVGKPLEQLFLRENATTTLCHSKTRDLKEITLNSDIVVAALNKQEYITSEFIKDGSIVIDVGVHRNNKGEIVGDVKYEDVCSKASLITPPVGGVGPMTINMLAYNTAKSLYGEEVEEILDKGIKKIKVRR